MKKKRIIASVLAFTLVLGNSAFANTYLPNRTMNSPSILMSQSMNKASDSNADNEDTTATNSNADKASDSNALMSKANMPNVSSLEVECNYAKGIKLKWTSNRAYLFHVYRSEGTNEPLLLDEVYFANYYTDVTAEAGKTYTYKVTAIVNNGTEIIETDGPSVQVVVSKKEVIIPDGNLAVNETKKMEVQFVDFTAEPAGVWSTDDNDLATIDSNGILTAKKRGVVNISYTLNDGYTKSCKYILHDKMVPPSVNMHTLRELEVFKITNRNRMKEGHKPLSMVPLMQTGTDIRKIELKTLYSHTRPDGRSCFSVFDDIGFSSYGGGENIAAGQHSPSAVLSVWMHSSGHYKNIMNDNFVHFAAGEKSNSWVQMFSGCSSDFNHMELFLPKTTTFKKNTSIDDFGVIAAFNCTAHGISYMPVISQMCTGYEPTQEKEQTITVTYNDLQATFTVTIKGSSSSSGSGGGGGGGGGGSSSGGGGGSSSSGGGGSSSGPGKGGIKTNASIPSYVIKGTWNQVSGGNWKFTDSNGVAYFNKWAAVENPYANTKIGQDSFDWFMFDGNGNMMTGWYQDAIGNRFYLNPNSDGTRGKMVTGWAWIADNNGVQKCYYLNPNSDGTRGKLITNTTIDGNTLNASGEWIVGGIAQTK